MKGVVAAVVTVAFNRPDYLQRHIASVLSVHGSDPANRHLSCSLSYHLQL